MKTAKRLTAVALVLLLLLSLCGCMAEEPIEEISRPETTRTTPATTLSTAPTTTATVIDTTASTVVSTTNTTDTATQTATTVVTTQVTTKVTVTATDPTAAPTTAAPQKPAIEWNVIKGELPEGGITPGAAFPYGKVNFCRLEFTDLVESDRHCGKIIESVAELDALVWNDPTYESHMYPIHQKPVYTEAFFKENVLVEFVRYAGPTDVTCEVFTTVEEDTLHITICILDYNRYGLSPSVIYDTRILVELRREDAARVKDIVVYETSRPMTNDELMDWYT